jgi:hypothetical protein
MKQKQAKHLKELQTVAVPEKHSVGGCSNHKSPLAVNTTRSSSKGLFSFN